MRMCWVMNVYFCAGVSVVCMVYGGICVRCIWCVCVCTWCVCCACGLCVVWLVWCGMLTGRRAKGALALGSSFPGHRAPLWLQSPSTETRSLVLEPIAGAVALHGAGLLGIALLSLCPFAGPRAPGCGRVEARAAPRAELLRVGIESLNLIRAPWPEL